MGKFLHKCPKLMAKFTEACRDSRTHSDLVVGIGTCACERAFMAELECSSIGFRCFLTIRRDTSSIQVSASISGSTSSGNGTGTRIVTNVGQY